MDIKTLLKNAHFTFQKTGKSLHSQFYELIWLRLGLSKLGADDYYLYKLYDDSLYSFKDKTQFIGWRTSMKIDKALNHDESRVFANDKLEFSMKMSNAGLRTPKILAVFNEDNIPISSVNQLSTTDEASTFLRMKNIYPVFIKPVHGTYGRGGFSAITVCTSNSTLKIGDGSQRSISEVIDQFKQKWAKGYIIQELLTPHSEVVSLIGQRLSSLRVIVILTHGKPHIFRAVWKLTAGRNMSDNFMHGKLGNLIANVNPENGNVTNVTGMRDGKMVPMNTHPDTGANLTGISVPLWTDVVEYCKQSSSLFPGLKMQHWDIAICPEGPIALEVNVEGSVDLHQLASRKGIYDEYLQNVMRQT